jgi:DNA-binding MarR family transcriptional regulator
MSATPRPDPCTCSAIRKAARHVTQLYDRSLAAAGLTVTQYAILARVDRAGTLTINELARRMAMDRTTLGRTVRPLERDGLVQIAPDPQDGRRRGLTLTVAGRERLAVARPLWAEAQARFEDAFGAEPTRALCTTLAGVLAVEIGPTNPSV